MARGSQAREIEIIYIAGGESVPIVISVGDSIRGQDWARKAIPDDPALQEWRGGLYAMFLAAKRARLPGTDRDWLDWLDLVTLPDDGSEPVEGPAEEPAAGEPHGPSSVS